MGELLYESSLKLFKTHFMSITVLLRSAIKIQAQWKSSAFPYVSLPMGANTVSNSDPKEASEMEGSLT